jgi:hypothetical protein
MVKFVSGALLAGFVSLALVGTAAAQPAAPDVTDNEFKCMASASKAGGKFTGGKAKCVSKCLSAFWKDDPDGSVTPESDCLPPYAGATAECVDDTVLDKKGAQDKFRDAILKACDAPGKECPNCYSGGDCSTSGEATNRVQTIEGQIDSFVPGVACERAGADSAEQKCMLNTAKVLAKYAAASVKCYDKCFSNGRKGTVDFADCAPPAADPATQECLTKAFDKSSAGVDKKCSLVVPSANPDCGGPDNYADGATWSNLVDIAVNGNVPGTYCDSPSGAFVD